MTRTGIHGDIIYINVGHATQVSYQPILFYKICKKIPSGLVTNYCDRRKSFVPTKAQLYLSGTVTPHYTAQKM